MNPRESQNAPIWERGIQIFHIFIDPRLWLRTFSIPDNPCHQLIKIKYENIMFLTFTQWNQAIPFTIVARNGGNPDSLISTIAVKPYRASVSEISIHLQAMFWIRGFSTWCYGGQYSSPMLYTIKCFYYRHYGERKVMYFIKSILNNGMQEEVSQFFAQDW